MSEPASRAQVEVQVKEALMQQLKLPPEKWSLTASIRHDLGIDSLDVVELMYDLEKRFEIVIPDEDLLKLVTIGDLIEYLSGKLNVTT